MLTNFPMCQHFDTPVLKSKLLKTNWPSIDTYKLYLWVILHLHQKLDLHWHFPGLRMTIYYLWMIFNMIISSPTFNELIEDYELSALISEPACFKSITSTRIDNFLISKKKLVLWIVLHLKRMYQITINLFEQC